MLKQKLAKPANDFMSNKLRAALCSAFIFVLILSSFFRDSRRAGAQTLMAAVISDTTVESDETFFVNLSNPGNATLADGQGLGELVNDNAPLATFTVTNTNDAGAGSLRQAITDANTSGGSDDITFSNTIFNTAQTINLATALPAITGSLTLNGPGANLLTVRRNAATNFRIFNISGGVSNVAISGLTISNGRAPGDFDFGGGILSLSNLTLTNVAVSGNQATSGGGVAMGFADGVFTNCTFSGNTATFGGGISYQGGSRTLRLVNSTVSGNVIVNNGNGGGIDHAATGSSSTLEVVNSTIANNTGAFGGGIHTFANAGETTTTTLRNSIIANNTTTNLARSGSGAATVTTNGFNLASDNGGGFLNVTLGDKIGQNPRLAPLSLIGGQTPAHALLGGSPALDAGDSSGSTTDQRGQPRVFDTPGVPGASDGADIGAVEMRSVFVTNADNGSAGSLRQVITDAPANSDILFDPAFFNVARAITLTTGELVINKNLNIHGTGANLLTVSGNNQSRVFFINFGFTASLSGMTMTGGNGVGANNSGFGGGILNVGNFTIADSTISGNTANNGGGIASAFGTFNLIRSTVSGNTANFQGGGLNLQNGNGTLTNSTISGNTANSSTLPGGGVFFVSSGGSFTLQATNCTIANNNTGTANTGSGILTQGSGATASATTLLRNTIIANNSLPNLRAVTFSGGAAAITSQGFNLASDDSSTFLNQTTDRNSAFAGLAPLGDNGGPTRTHALLGSSAALDAGNNSGSGVLTDQRGAGFARTVDLAAVTNQTGSDGTDIGAYEAQTAPATFTVTNLDNAGAGSLRQAVLDANANGTGQDTINFAALFNTPQTITLTSGELAIGSSLTINGPGANLLTVSGGGASRVFNIPAGFTVSLSGMTITGGNSPANTGGGGILSNGNLTVSNCNITGNTAPFGGGILNASIAVLTLLNSTVSNNTANGPGGSAGGGIDSAGALTVTNSTISGNTSTVGNNNAGGIWFRTNSATITNSTITNNSAAGTNSASGLYMPSGTLSIRNSIIAGNVNNATVPDVFAVGNAGITSSGYNLIGNRGTVAFGGTGDQAGGNGNPIINPLLGPLTTNNGGTTPTHALLASSPAIDKGNSSGSNTDQRGLTRPVDLPSIPNPTGGDDGADIGAFEAQSAPATPSFTINDVSQNEGNAGTSNFTFTVTLSLASAQTVTVDYMTANGTATAPSDYTAIPQTTLTFAPGETSKVLNVSVVGDTTVEPDETFNVNLLNNQGALISDNQGVGTIVNDDTAPTPATFAFSVANFNIGEADARATVFVIRTGDTTISATVDYLTVDNPAAIRCDDTTTLPGVSFARCDYATSLDTLTFAPGETTKSFTVPIINDVHVEPIESFTLRLLNPTNATLGAQATATVSILDNDTAGQPNPVLTQVPFFVRQQYLDFLSREPEQGEPWSAILNGCPNIFNFDPQNPSARCDRIIVSQSFFGSPEFRLKGFYVFTHYRVAFARLAEYAEIVADMRAVTGQTSADTFARRAQFPVSFTGRTEFRGLYDNLSNTAYVNTLLDRYALPSITTPDPANPEGGTKVTLTRADLVTRLGVTGAQALTRAQALRAIVESDEVSAAEFTNTFVATQYYGYLRRKPDAGGYQGWLNFLNANPTDSRTMVNGFLNSVEYRLRFGQP